ncbi:hypothetical protein B0H14DRAFT_2610213 [Mycena olivaceomarginata]|nr:hypothetical protein B0H14DRAFT_2610213 [Mycena olivaceomarginata]
MSTSFNFFGSVKSDARYAITLPIVYRSLRRNSAIRQINGPPSPSWLFDLREKLRAEIHATAGSARFRGAVYDSMPLLNAFIKAISECMAVKDVSIPVADGIRASRGQHISCLPVRKGQIVNLGIASYQRTRIVLWGQRAGQKAFSLRPPPNSGVIDTAILYSKTPYSRTKAEPLLHDFSTCLRSSSRPKASVKLQYNSPKLDGLDGYTAKVLSGHLQMG